MPVLTLIAWIITAMAGLYLLAIWLIEYDPDFQRAAATRLPVPVVCGHVLLAVGGLGTWVMYLLTDKKTLCWIAAGDLAVIAALGLTMAVRWVGVYRTNPGHASGRATMRARPSGIPVGPVTPGDLAVPPERNFPVPLVIAHGIFAITTIALAALTVLGVGGS